MEPKYKTIFATQIRPIEPTEETRNEAKASLSRLRNLLPDNIDPADEPAILFVAGNLAVAGMVNLNDDGVDIETGITIAKKFIWQQINIEHNRDNKVGFVIHAGFSELGTDRILTEDEVRAANKPFNIAVVIALWRVGKGHELCQYIEEASTPTHPDFNALSLSFEVGFDEYRVVALPKGSPYIADANIVVKPEEAAFGRFDAALRANKGSGLSPDDANLRVFRIIDSGVLPLGGGIVTVPAAAVKGLVAIVEKPAVQVEETTQASEEKLKRLAEEKAAQDMALALEEAKNTACAFFARVEEKITSFLNPSQTRVSPTTPIHSSHMKPSDLKAIFASISKAKPEEIAQLVASADPVLDAIIKKSEEIEAARKLAESHASEIEAAKTAALASAATLSTEIAALRAELKTIKDAQASAAAEESFQNRMKVIEAEFDLNDEERGFVAEEIKDVTDEVFAKKVDKFKKMMNDKRKGVKKAKEDESKAAKDELIAKLLAKNVKASYSNEGLVIDEVIAAALATETSTAAGSIVKVENSGDLKDLATKALAGLSFGQSKK